MKNLWSLPLFTLLSISSTQRSKNNVCKNITDYKFIDINENCWYNPDVGSSAREIITRRGYPFETYTLTTEDKYILNLYRIPHNNSDSEIARKPILLHSGMTSGPGNYLMMGNRSLPFYLVNKGYDVWLSNRRGTYQGTEHQEFEKTDPKFWDFSFHEIGFYDLKAEIDFIRQKTNKKVILLGFSLGTTETYVYAITRQRHSKQNVAGIVSLAPFAFMKKSGGILAQLATIQSKLERMFINFDMKPLFSYENVNRLMPNKNKIRFSFEVLLLVKSHIYNIVGKDSGQTDIAELPVYLATPTLPLSVKTLKHFTQEINANGSFQYFDYGTEKNKELYNSTTVPSYDIGKIKVPVHLFYGEEDLLSHKEDVLTFFDKLSVKQKSLTSVCEKRQILFNHMDFVMAKDIEELLYEDLIKKMEDLM